MASGQALAIIFEDGMGIGCWSVSLLCAALLAGGLWRVPKADRSSNVSLLLYGLLPILAVFVLSRIATPLFIDRIFTNSSVVVPIVFACPFALQKGRKGRMLYGFLGIVLAAATAVSGVGYLRYQEKEDWRGAISSLLRIPERNRLIVFIPRMGELLFDYYAQRSSAMGLGLAKIALPVSYIEGFPPPRGGQIHASHLNRLKLAVESGRYSEIDLVLSYERHDDPNETVLNYSSQVFICGEEQRFTRVRINVLCCSQTAHDAGFRLSGFIPGFAADLTETATANTWLSSRNMREIQFQQAPLSSMPALAPVSRNCGS